MLGSTVSDLRHSQQGNKGEGGVDVQMAKLSKAIEKQPPKPRKKVQDMPPMEPVNPMAPVPKQKWSRPKAKGSEADTLAAVNMENAAPQFIVPLGSEPPIPGCLPSTYGHEFGFQAPTHQPPGLVCQAPAPVRQTSAPACQTPAPVRQTAGTCNYGYGIKGVLIDIISESHTEPII